MVFPVIILVGKQRALKQAYIVLNQRKTTATSYFHGDKEKFKHLLFS